MNGRVVDSHSDGLFVVAISEGVDHDPLFCLKSSFHEQYDFTVIALEHGHNLLFDLEVLDEVVFMKGCSKLVNGILDEDFTLGV